MIDEMVKITKNLSGSIVGIGIDNKKMLDTINNNDKIKNCFLLENKNTNEKSFLKKGKTVNIRYLHKKFHYKKIDYTIMHYEDVFKYSKYFTKNSVFITKKSIYLYGKYNKELIDDLFKKYRRYNIKLNLNKYNNNFILEVDSSKAKNNWFTDKYYFVIDSITEMFSVLEEMLIK